MLTRVQPWCRHRVYWADAGMPLMPEEEASTYFPASTATATLLLLWRVCCRPGSQQALRGLDFVATHPLFNRAEWITAQQQNQLLYRLPIIPAHRYWLPGEKYYVYTVSGSDQSIGGAEIMLHRLQDLLDRAQRNPELMQKCRWHPELVCPHCGEAS